MIYNAAVERRGPVTPSSRRPATSTRRSPCSFERRLRRDLSRVQPRDRSRCPCRSFRADRDPTLRNPRPTGGSHASCRPSRGPSLEVIDFEGLTPGAIAEQVFTTFRRRADRRPRHSHAATRRGQRCGRVRQPPCLAPTTRIWARRTSPSEERGSGTAGAPALPFENRRALGNVIVVAADRGRRGPGRISSTIRAMRTRLRRRARARFLGGRTRSSCTA